MEEPPSHARRLVIEGNRAWDAGQVRKRWLAEVLFARRSAPRDVAVFVARQLLTMPEPLHTNLTIAPARTSFSEITRQNAEAWRELCDTAAAARLPLLMLAPIAVTYEYAMTEGLGRATWRTDHTYSPCPRAEAGRYLAFLASLGHHLAPIEQAVADGVPYTGDDPDDQLTTEDGDGATPEGGSTGQANEGAASSDLPDGEREDPAPEGVSPGVVDVGKADIQDGMPGHVDAGRARSEEVGPGDAGNTPSQAAA